MKKSNKLLVGGFLTVLLFITAIHVSLYAKYQAGDFTLYNAEDDLAPLAMQSFPNIVFVSVRNVPGATVRFADVAQLQKDKNDGWNYTQKGDTLQITGNNDLQGFRESVVFHLPAAATMALSNSSISFEAGNKPVPGTPTILLNKSVAIFSGERTPLQMGDLRVVASDQSLLLFRGKGQVAGLDVQLSQSAIEADGSEFGRLAITTDSISRISLPAKQLLKATIKPTGTE